MKSAYFLYAFFLVLSTPISYAADGIRFVPSADGVGGQCLNSSGAEAYRFDQFTACGRIDLTSTRYGQVNEPFHLKGRDLRGIVILDIDMISSDLRQTDFNGAVISAALDDTELEGARFIGADLRYSTFDNADFRGNDFLGADLRAVKFFTQASHQAKVYRGLRSSQLAGAYFDEYTRFPFSREEALAAGMIYVPRSKCSIYKKIRECI